MVPLSERAVTHDRIILRGVRATGYHGVFDHERRDGQEFVVDATLWLSLERPALSDDVAHTVHYGLAAEMIAARIAGEPVDLIERLAALIADDLLHGHPALGRLAQSELLERVAITVHKPHAPIEVAFGDVSVTIERTPRDPRPRVVPAARERS